MDEFQEIPEPVRELLWNTICSVEQLESLLLMRKHRTNAFTEDELASRLYTSSPGARATLSYLAREGLLEKREDGSYVYHPSSLEMDEAVAKLEELYRQRKVSIIRAIYNTPK